MEPTCAHTSLAHTTRSSVNVEDSAHSHPSIINLGITDYPTAHATQLEVVESVIQNPNQERLIITQHHPVYTCGRATLPTDRPISDIPQVDVERGGKLTYHGPGQIVIYPILNFNQRKLGVKEFLCQMEDTVISVLNDLDLIGERREEFLAGVWVNQRKICSIGIALKKWVSYHGLALNVNCDLTPFRDCTPCGLSGDKITSIKEEIGCHVSYNQVETALASRMTATFF